MGVSASPGRSREQKGHLGDLGTWVFILPAEAIALAAGQQGSPQGGDRRERGGGMKVSNDFVLESGFSSQILLILQILPKVTLFFSSQTHRNRPLANLETSKTRKETKLPLPSTHFPGPPDKQGAEPRKTPARPHLGPQGQGKTGVGTPSRRGRSQPDCPFSAVLLSLSGCTPTFPSRPRRAAVALVPGTCVWPSRAAGPRGLRGGRTAARPQASTVHRFRCRCGW